MSNLTRRAVMAGIAASPALALPAVASIGPDSELLRLERDGINPIRLGIPLVGRI
jgi:hypothetical protein